MIKNDVISTQRDNYKEYQKNIKTLGNPVFSRVFFMSECLQKVVKIGRFFTVAHKFSWQILKMLILCVQSNKMLSCGATVKK